MDEQDSTRSKEHKKGDAWEDKRMKTYIRAVNEMQETIKKLAENGAAHRGRRSLREATCSAPQDFHGSG